MASKGDSLARTQGLPSAPAKQRFSYPYRPNGGRERARRLAKAGKLLIPRDKFTPAGFDEYARAVHHIRDPELLDVIHKKLAAELGLS